MEQYHLPTFLKSNLNIASNLYRFCQIKKFCNLNFWKICQKSKRPLARPISWEFVSTLAWHHCLISTFVKRNFRIRNWSTNSFWFGRKENGSKFMLFQKRSKVRRAFIKIHLLRNCFQRLQEHCLHLLIKVDSKPVCFPWLINTS